MGALTVVGSGETVMMGACWATMGRRMRPGDPDLGQETHFAYGYWRTLHGEFTKLGKPKARIRAPSSKAGSVRLSKKGGPCTNANDHQTGWWEASQPVYGAGGQPPDLACDQLWYRTAARH